MPAEDLPEQAQCLTEWEIAEITPVSNPAWWAYERGFAFGGQDEDQAERNLIEKVRDVPTPAGLSLRTSASTKQRVRWSTRAVAVELGVKPTTVRSWLARGQMPDPDGRDAHGSPWWRPETITTWNASRPGLGWRGSPTTDD